MKSLAVLLFVFPLSLFAQEKKWTGALSLSGTESDYITGGKTMSFDSKTGFFIVRLDKDQNAIEVEYEDAKGSEKNNNFRIALQPVQGEKFEVREYLFASRFPFNSNVEVKRDYNGHVYEKTMTSGNGFSLSGNGRGCNGLSASFEIKNIRFNDKTKNIEKLEVSFKQYCDNAHHYSTGTLAIEAK